WLVFLSASTRCFSVLSANTLGGFTTREKIGHFISSMNKSISTKPEKIATLATLPPRRDSSLTLPTLAEREGKITVTRLISALEQQAAEFRIRFSFWQVFSIFFLLWALFFWPALHEAWWAMDDFYLIEWTNAVRWGKFVVGNGRPLLGVWSYSYLLDSGPGQ